MTGKTGFGCSLTLCRIGRLQQCCNGHRRDFAPARCLAAALGHGYRITWCLRPLCVKDFFRHDMETEGGEQGPEHGTGDLVEFETVHARLAREKLPGGMGQPRERARRGTYRFGTCRAISGGEQFAAPPEALNLPAALTRQPSMPILRPPRL